MLANAFLLVADLCGAALQLVYAQTAHGEGLEGASMGPVQFLWPNDRPWSASEDNIAPCGSASIITNRTEFPLSAGAVSLSIADDAWNVAFRIAYDNSPTIQSDFVSQIVSNISAIEAGHQCYRTPATPSNIVAGTNATIQLEYWAKEDGGKNESFSACADITFVDLTALTESIPCFNVTVTEFEAPATTTTTASTVSPTVLVFSANNELSTGAKTGIAVGSILGAALIVGAALLSVIRKRASTPTDTEKVPYMPQKAAGSFVSQWSAPAPAPTTRQ